MNPESLGLYVGKGCSGCVPKVCWTNLRGIASYHPVEDVSKRGSTIPLQDWVSFCRVNWKNMYYDMTCTPPLKVTVHPWKWMVWLEYLFPFGARPIFRDELFVLGSVVFSFIGSVMQSSYALRSNQKKFHLRQVSSYWPANKAPMQLVLSTNTLTRK